MLIWKMAIKGIKTRRGFSFMIFMMIIVISLFIITASNVLLSADRIWQEKWDEANYPEYIVLFDNDYMQSRSEHTLDDYLEYFNAHPDVEKAQTQTFVYIEEAQNTWGGKKGFPMLLFPDSSLKQGEIKPLYYMSAMGTIKDGDEVELTWGEGETLHFTAAGSFVDAMTGGQMLGVHFVPISQEDFDFLCDEVPTSTAISVYVASEEDIPRIVKGVGGTSDAMWSWTKSEIKGYMLVIPDMIGYFLMAMAIILTAAVLLALRHSLLASLESDYKTIGVLKGIGFDNSQIARYTLLQYLIIVLSASVIGAALSILIEKPALFVFLSFAGLPSEITLFPLLILGTILGLCFITMLTAWLSARRIYRVSPVRAIAQGQSPVHFSRRLNPPIGALSWLGRDFRLTVKQAAARPSQLAIVFVISTLFCYILITLLGFYGAMDDVRSAAKIFGLPNGDIAISVYTDENGRPIYDVDDIIDEIDKEAGVSLTYYGIGTAADVEGVSIRVDGYSNFDDIDFAKPISGRFPKYSNEVMITPQVKNLFSVNIGDEMTLKGNSAQAGYIVCGVMSSAMDMGKIVMLSTEGAARISDNEEYSVVVLKNPEKGPELMEQLSDKYGDGAWFVNTSESVNHITSSIRLGIMSITAIIIFIAALLIMLTTALIAQIAIIRERSDMAVLRAVGYSSSMLRRQFSQRFLLASSCGCLFGLVLSLFLSDKMMSTVLGLAGMSSFEGDKSWWVFALPVLLLCVFTTLVAHTSARRIKKISIQDLVAE